MKIVSVLLLIALSAVPTAAQQREGITVHGSWVVEVRNPDGSVAARQAFENRLVQGGVVIAEQLTRTGSPVSWHVVLSSAVLPASGPVEVGTHIDADVGLLKEILSQDGLNDLIVTRPPPYDAIILKGTTRPLTAPRTLRSVGTVTGTRVFSAKNLPAPIELVVDQSLNVSVVISFSSAPPATTPQR